MLTQALPDGRLHRRQCKQALEPLDHHPQPDGAHPAPPAVGALGGCHQRDDGCRSRGRGQEAGGPAARRAGPRARRCQGARGCRCRSQAASRREEAREGGATRRPFCHRVQWLGTGRGGHQQQRFEAGTRASQFLYKGHASFAGIQGRGGEGLWPRAWQREGRGRRRRWIDSKGGFDREGSRV